MNIEASTLLKGLQEAGILKTPAVIEAFNAVDRQDFVTADHVGEAYRDEPLPIGHGQTISQPLTVAFMLELLGPQTGERILDIGAGSGWTTALLAHIVGQTGHVYGTEVIPELVEFGQNNIEEYANEHAEIREASDTLGLPEEAPFDRILVSAASRELPKELMDQLSVGGVMVIPVNGDIWRVEKRSDADHEIEKIEGFAFVPLV